LVVDIIGQRFAVNLSSSAVGGRHNQQQAKRVLLVDRFDDCGELGIVFHNAWQQNQTVAQGHWSKVIRERWDFVNGHFGLAFFAAVSSPSLII
jgi:hypothetical protein